MDSEIVKVNKYEDVENICKSIMFKQRREYKISFICPDCGKEVVNHISNIVNKNNYRLLCQKCLARETRIKTFGSEENYRKVREEKRLATIKEKYGSTKEAFSHPPKDYTAKEREAINNKTLETKIKKYGSLENAYKIRNLKTKETCIEKYGVDNINKLDSVLQKRHETNLKKYGYTCSLLNDKVKEKSKKTIREKYGVDNVSQSEEIKKKKEQTTFKHFGVYYPSQSPEVIKKWKRNNLERYGTEFPASLPEIKEKAKTTCFRKYNAKCSSRSHISKESQEILDSKEKLLELISSTESKEEILSKLNIVNSTLTTYMKTYGIYNDRAWKNLKNVSAYEIYLFDFLKEKFPLLEIIRNDRNIISPLEIDIYIPEKNLAVEFNGIYWHSFYEKNYHKNKTNICKNKGIRLFHIWEDEWIKDKNTILDILCSIIEGKENLKTDNIIKLDLSCEDPNNYPNYKLIEEIDCEGIKRKSFIVYNCGYGIYEKW